MRRIPSIVLALVGACLHACASTKNDDEGASGRVLVVVEKGLGSVGFYTEDGKRLSGAPVGEFPHEMVFSADRKLAYVTDNGSLRFTDDVEGGNTVSVIDLETRRKTKTIPLGRFRRPHGISLDAETGLLAVSVENPDRLLLIDPEKGEIVSDHEVGGTTPHMVTLAPGARRAYVMNAQSANVSVVDLETGDLTLIPVGENPQGSVLSRDGAELYVTCEDHISVIDVASTKEVARFGSGANRIVLTADGGLLLYSSLLPGVGFADPKSRSVLFHLDLPHRPFSINVSKDEEYVYLAAEEQDIVYTVSVSERRIIREFRTPEGTRPDPVMDL